MKKKFKGFVQENNAQKRGEKIVKGNRVRGDTKNRLDVVATQHFCCGILEEYFQRDASHQTKNGSMCDHMEKEITACAILRKIITACAILKKELRQM